MEILAMPRANRFRVRLSTGGRITLPKALRDRYDWTAARVMEIRDGANGVTLKAAPLVPPTRLEEVAGMLKQFYTGPAKTIEEMDAAITEEVRARMARGEY